MSNKKKSLKNSLKAGNLIGGGVSGLEGADTITHISGPNDSTTLSLQSLVTKSQSATSAITRVGKVENALGGQAKVSYLVNYVSSPNPTVFVPNATAPSGLLGWVADQIKVATPPAVSLPPAPVQQNIIDNINNNYLSVPNNTNNNTIVPLGSALTIGGTQYVNRLLTLQDLVGILNNGVLSFAPDVQAAIESSPLAQFKHLPSITSLNTTTPPP